MENEEPQYFNYRHSSADSSLSTSSSDEEKKMEKRAKQNDGFDYKPDPVPGYRNILPEPYSKSLRQCPPHKPKPEYRQTPMSMPQSVRMLDEPTVRSSLLKFVNYHTCWRLEAAKKMELSDVISCSAFTYRCEFFTEERKVKWKARTYQSIDIADPPSAEEAPQPWSMELNPVPAWHEKKVKVEVPHSRSVRKCFYCRAKGLVICRPCFGLGDIRCTRCHSTGLMDATEWDTERKDCAVCGSRGRYTCFSCDGEGTEKCKKCEGTKRLMWFVQNSVEWKTREITKIFEAGVVPEELVANLNTQVLFSDEHEILEPLEEFPEEHVQQFSRDVLQEIMEKYKDHRILRMRHTVLMTPVTKVTWKFEDQSGKFFVYGVDNMVYFPDYPQQCCCSLL